ncbi:MAG TPA: histidine kinase [Longimicrobiales bacterium]
MSSAWAWAALTLPIAVLVRRVRPALRDPRTLFIHLLAIAGVHALLTLVDNYTFYFISKQLTNDFLTSYRRGFAQTALLYATTALAVLALDHARLARKRAVQAAQLESDLTRARLETLRRQIRPHFLFNTLHTISELIDTDPPRAGIMVTRLGDLLRRSLDDQAESMIPLEAELDFVRLYTEIEQVRFEGWLRVSQRIDDRAAHAFVPPMILQPLVENAIKHGIAPSGRIGSIEIRARRDDDRHLCIDVVDDGVGMTQNGGTRLGIGLTTTRERLAHLFGNDAAVNIASSGTGTTVSLQLPFITQAH